MKKVVKSDPASQDEEVVRETDGQGDEQLWTDKDTRRFTALEWGGDWRDAVNLLNDWLAEETHPIKRYHIAKEGRYRLHGRLWNHMSEMNRNRFELEYQDIVKDMERVMVEAETA